MVDKLFHVNPETLEVGTCRAQTHCPFGGPHYRTFDEAVDAVNYSVFEYNGDAKFRPDVFSIVGKEDENTSAVVDGKIYRAHNLVGKGFHNENLNFADFSEATLIGTNFTNTELEDADFSNANLTGASFVDCNLENVNFENANLTGASFQNCSGEANFKGANLIGVSGELPGATNEKDTHQAAPLKEKKTTFVPDLSSGDPTRALLAKIIEDDLRKHAKYRGVESTADVDKWDESIIPDPDWDYGSPQEWENYLNSCRFGYGVEIPKGYEAFPGIYDLNGNPVCVIPNATDRENRNGKSVVIHGEHVLVRPITKEQWELPFEERKKELEKLGYRVGTILAPAEVGKLYFYGSKFGVRVKGLVPKPGYEGCSNDDEFLKPTLDIGINNPANDSRITPPKSWSPDMLKYNEIRRGSLTVDEAQQQLHEVWNKRCEEHRWTKKERIAKQKAQEDEALKLAKDKTVKFEQLEPTVQRRVLEKKKILLDELTSTEKSHNRKIVEHEININELNRQLRAIDKKYFDDRAGAELRLKTKAITQPGFTLKDVPAVFEKAKRERQLIENNLRKEETDLRAVRKELELLNFEKELAQADFDDATKIVNENK